LAYKPGSNVRDLWTGVKGDTSGNYNDAQRNQADEWLRMEDAWAGTDREGLSQRYVDQFNALSAPAAPPAETPPAGGGTGSGSGSGGSGSAATTTEDALANDKPASGSTTTEGTQDIFNDTLIKLIGQDPSNVSISDPNLRPQADAFRASQEHSRRQRQEAAAEALGSRGMESSGAMDAEVASSWDDMGRNVATHDASLIAGELQARRSEIMQALALAGNTINADLARDLQRELSNIDAALRREGFSLQDKLGSGDIDLRRFLGTGQLNLGLLDLLLGDEHFKSNLGFQIGSKEADMNTAALLALLSGG
jgi:hypothetical protein